MLVGLGSVVLLGALWLILPIVSWMRVSRLKRELADVQGRLAALESTEAQRLAARLKVPARDAATSEAFAATMPAHSLKSP